MDQFISRPAKVLSPPVAPENNYSQGQVRHSANPPGLQAAPRGSLWGSQNGQSVMVAVDCGPDAIGALQARAYQNGRISPPMSGQLQGSLPDDLVQSADLLPMPDVPSRSSSYAIEGDQTELWDRLVHVEQRLDSAVEHSAEMQHWIAEIQRKCGEEIASLKAQPEALVCCNGCEEVRAQLQLNHARDVWNHDNLAEKLRARFAEMEELFARQIAEVQDQLQSTCSGEVTDDQSIHELKIAVESGNQRLRTLEDLLPRGDGEDGLQGHLPLDLLTRLHTAEDDLLRSKMAFHEKFEWVAGLEERIIRNLDGLCQQECKQQIKELRVEERLEKLRVECLDFYTITRGKEQVPDAWQRNSDPPNQDRISPFSARP